MGGRGRAFTKEVAPPTPELPGWLAPSVLIALVGTVLNFGLNFLNFRRSATFRMQEHRRGEFERLVGTPIESCAQALDEFIFAMAALRASFGREVDSLETREKRVSACRNAQRETADPLRGRLEHVLNSASKHTTQPDWVELVDGFDGVLYAFDTLCRSDVAQDALFDAFRRLEDSASGTAQALRQRVANHMSVIMGLQH